MDAIDLLTEARAHVHEDVASGHEWLRFVRNIIVKIPVMQIIPGLDKPEHVRIKCNPNSLYALFLQSVDVPAGTYRIIFLDRQDNIICISKPESRQSFENHF